MTFLEKVEDARNLIRSAYESYPQICVGCSFGKDSMVTLHIVRSVAPEIPVISILADTEFQETYDFANRIEKEWNLPLTTHVFKQEGEGEMCCGKPKVEMTKVALAPYSAWISGVRRTEGITRANFEPIETKNGLTKINPILLFTELDIWRYLALNDIPVNPKYKEGYRSLGCALCSFPEADENESERAGRWKGTGKVCGECGIHTQALR
ncbi:MAG TPA: phosphoadenosine phosphosulfate reductase family protein [Candidatus Paceibacterota bacterium]|nr:phosphoadenosine phosphosulfate reductase family protein [Candidatus Paceibacterota bacterium]